jgi:hypothetical protein
MERELDPAVGSQEKETAADDELILVPGARVSFAWRRGSVHNGVARFP